MIEMKQMGNHLLCIWNSIR